MKRPKKPKQSSGIKAWENYDKKIAKYNSDKKKKESIINKHS